jgi:hypothetical protein
MCCQALRTGIVVQRTRAGGEHIPGGLRQVTVRNLARMPELDEFEMYVINRSSNPDPERSSGSIDSGCSILLTGKLRQGKIE